MDTERPGEARRSITQRDVARAADVSQAAVSRVMAGKGYVAADARRRILETATALGYRPDPLARSLIKGRSDIIAIVTASIVNPFFPVALDALTDAMRGAGREVLLFSAADGRSIDDLILDVLRYKVAGIIITSSALSGRAAELCDRAGVPVVLFHRYSDRGDAFAVACDSRAGGAAAAGMLIAAGCRRFGYLGGNSDSSPNRDRREGFLAALRAAGGAPATVAEHAFTYRWGWRGAARLLSEDPDLDGIFCGDDAIACGVVDALRHELGRRVPEDISVIGFDDVPQAGWAAYRLTTIRQPLDAMIERTLALLDDPGAFERGLHTVPGVVIRRATVRD